MVLWTRLTGDGLGERVEVTWEIAEDERFQRVVASGSETAEAAWAHSVHAEPLGLKPARWYWYRFGALGDRSAAGRTRTAPAPADAATLDFAIASCQRWDVGHYAAWRDIAGEDLDLVLFLGDYIYEYPSRPDALRRVEGGLVTTLAEYRARYATYKSDPALQAAHARLPWLLVWDDHEVANDYADRVGERLEAGFAERRAAAYQAYWEHLPFPKSARPRGPDMRIPGRLDGGGSRASTCSTTASTAHSRPARSRAAAAPTRWRSPTAPSCSTRGAACSARRRNAGSPRAGTASVPGTCLHSRR
jgi:alkaline phosphatase D